MKTFKLIVFSLVILAVVLHPKMFVFAQQDTNTADSLCDRLDSVEAKMMNSIQSKRRKPVEPAAIKPQLDPSSVEEFRKKGEALRKKHFEAIIQNLPSQEHKQAVETYRDELEKAINTRRTNIDAAQARFHSELFELQNQHHQAVISAEQELIDQLQDFFITAQNSCQAGQSSTEVRSELANSVAGAKKEFLQTKQNLNTNVLKYRQLLQERNNMVTTAIEDFHTTEKEARQKLLSALQSQ